MKNEEWKMINGTAGTFGCWFYNFPSPSLEEDGDESKEETLRKNEKKEVSVKLMEIMKNNEIDVFDIKDGQICYSKKSIKKPITKKTLMDTLTKYFKGDLLKAGDINNYIIENREEIVKETIVRKLNKED